MQEEAKQLRAEEKKEFEARQGATTSSEEEEGGAGTYIGKGWIMKTSGRTSTTPPEITPEKVKKEGGRENVKEQVDEKRKRS